jgi:hypothetical protein
MERNFIRFFPDIRNRYPIIMKTLLGENGVHEASFLNKFLRLRKILHLQKVLVPSQRWCPVQLVPRRKRAPWHCVGFNKLASDTSRRVYVGNSKEA